MFKKVILLVLLYFLAVILDGCAHSDCDGECEDIQPYFRVKGIESVFMAKKFKYSQIYDYQMIPRDSMDMFVNLDAEFYGKELSFAGFFQKAMACECDLHGFMGSYHTLNSFDIILETDFNGHQKGDTISDEFYYDYYGRNDYDYNYFSENYIGKQLDTYQFDLKYAESIQTPDTLQVCVEIEIENNIKYSCKSNSIILSN